MTDVLTTTEAARLASVAPSTIKRWVDRGALPSTRTLGGHRRVSRLALERFLQARVAGEGEVPPEAREVDAWVNDDQFAIEASLLRSRSRLGAWFRVADAVGEGLVHLGERWAAGRVTIADEHRAADALARALTRVGDALPVSPDAAVCALATAEGDEHTLGLRLAELCLREAGWAVRWLGRATPTDELLRLVRRGHVAMVGLSASSASDDAARLCALAGDLGRVCARRDVRLVLGGEGAWPEHPEHAVRVRTFRDLRALLERGGAAGYTRDRLERAPQPG